MSPRPEIDDVMSFILRAGSIMQKSGAETYRVEETIERIALSWRMKRVEPFATPTGLVITLEDLNGFTRTEVLRISGRAIDLNKVVQVNDLSRRIVSGGMEFQQAKHVLNEIEALHKAYPDYLYLLAAGICSGSIAILFDGNMLEFSVAAVAGCAVQCTLVLLGKFRTNRFINAFTGGAVSAGIALLGKSLLPEVNLDKVISGAIMTLVPGVAITNAIRDIINEDLVSGGSRGLDAFLTAMAIAGGAAIVLGLAV